MIDEKPAPAFIRCCRRLCRSTSIWLVVLLCSVNLLIGGLVAAYDPLQWLDELELISLDRLGITKVTDILQSGQDPTVVILGSSLMLFPAFRLDDELGIRPGSHGSASKEHIHRILSYSRAGYLERLLSSRSESPITVTNAAVAGSLISDQYLIAKKYLATGKRPQICVLTVAPRDFLDNVRKEIDRTATSTILADFVSPPEFAGLIVSDPGQAVGKVGPLVGTTLNAVSVCYRSRSDLQQLISGTVARLTGYPVSLLHVAAHQSKASSAAAAAKHGPATPTPIATNPTDTVNTVTNTLPDLGAYREMYLPLNEELFRKQQAYFGKLLELLKSNNIPTVVVDMPLTKENLALLPSNALQQYRETIDNACRTYDARLWHPELNLELDDFSDSAHMNASGGKKFFSALDSYLSRTDLIRNTSLTGAQLGYTRPQ